jgi:hypothetical protein
MRVPPDVDLSELTGLIRRQARLALLLGKTDPICPAFADPAPTLLVGDRDATQRWVDLCDRLVSLVEVDIELDYWAYEGGIGGEFHRVDVVGMNPLFPPEWRCAAWTTVLPGDLAEWLSRWRRWYDLVRSGHLRHYLTRMWAWEKLDEVRQAHDALLAQARNARRRQNESVTEADFRAACERVLSLPAPPEIPPPGPPPTSARDDRPTPEQARLVAALIDHVELLRTTAIDYSRFVTHGSRARVRLRFPEPDEYLQAHGPWLEKFLDWADPIARSRRGLYFWY